MTRKTTTILHSRTGLSALAAGLRLINGSPANLVSELLRLWPHMRKPGQFVSLEREDNRVICFNSGAAPHIVQRVFDTSAALWWIGHLTARELREGPLIGLRAMLVLALPSQHWLIHYELTAGE